MPPDISFKLFNRTFKNPVIVASGTFGGIFEKVVDLNKLGGIVLKSVTVNPRKGNPTPRIMETPSGTVNSIGLENPGIELFLKEYLPTYTNFQTNIIVNIAGKTADEYTLLAEKVGEHSERQKNIAAIELNLSCPNVSGGLDFATKPELTFETVSKVKKASALPIIAKLSPNVTDIIPIAKACVDAKADAVSLINTVKAMVVDWKSGKSMLGTETGGLSGPAIKPIAIRFVAEIKKAFPNLCVIGIGGITTCKDVLEFLSVGACAVQIGTANFVQPDVSTRIIEELQSIQTR